MAPLVLAIFRPANNAPGLMKAIRNLASITCLRVSCYDHWDQCLQNRRQVRMKNIEPPGPSLVQPKG